MSSGLPYLQKQLKSQLTEFADITDLQDYNQHNKPELAVALDEHLRANRSIFAGDDRLAEYYRRLSQPGRFSSPVKSPVKREAKIEVASPKVATPKVATPKVTSPKEQFTITRSSRRLSTKPKEEEIEATDDSSDDASEAASVAASVPEVKTPSIRTPAPARSPLSVQPPLPPSPAVVTDAIDQQTAVWRENIHDAWKASGVQERSNALRSILSSTKAVEVIVLFLEAFGIIKEIVPWRFLTTVPAIEAIHSSEFAIKVPDLFVLVDGVFWAPFSLWLLTSLFLPLSVAYFFNISLGQTSGPRRGDLASFDPLSFNIAKALIAYLVYGQQFTFWGLYSAFSLAKVNASVPGQWAGIVTGAAIGGVGTFYEAILRK